MGGLCCIKKRRGGSVEREDVLDRINKINKI